MGGPEGVRQSGVGASVLIRTLIRVLQSHRAARSMRNGSCQIQNPHRRRTSILRPRDTDSSLPNPLGPKVLPAELLTQRRTRPAMGRRSGAAEVHFRRDSDDRRQVP